MSVITKESHALDRVAWARTAIFAATTFLSAFLLFLVQPMAAKRLLPAFGGTPAVWTVSMLFFQLVLLGGYFYAHLLISRLKILFQTGLHSVLFVLGLGALWWTANRPVEPDPTSAWTTSAPLLFSLAGMVGPAFFLLSTTAPILQGWFLACRSRPTDDPYFLYVASNLGSLAALLLYPFVVEPGLTLDEQFQGWRWGLILLAMGIASCMAFLCVGSRDSLVPASEKSSTTIGRDAWLIWIFAAFVPSSLLLGVTTYLTTDLSSIPLLWIAPLALYLVTFIVAFSRWNRWSTRLALRLYPLILILIALSLGFGVVKSYLLPVHLLGFFLAAMLCHGKLAERRPSPDRLTSFYLAISVGGCLGGVFNGLVAPWVFTSLAEYPFALVLAAFVVAIGSKGESSNKPTAIDALMPIGLGMLTAMICANLGGLAESPLGAAATALIAGLTLLIVVRHRRCSWRFAMTVGALLVASRFSDGVNGKLLLQERSFFGVTRVTEVTEGPFHRMFHGSTLHGQQGLSPELRHTPLSYFTESGPVGDLFRARRALGPIGKAAVAGLGAGSLLTYAEAQEDWSVYEIDPAIVRIASDRRYFTYVEDCQARSLKLTVGDARLEIAKQSPSEFSMIFLDAFSSDAIPMHLITREALVIYRKRCTKDGWVIFNISNRYLDLIPVVALLAEDAGLACRVRVDGDVQPDEKAIGKRGSIWAVMASSDRDLGEIGRDPRWFRPRVKPGDRVWTDGYSEIFHHLRWGTVSPRS